jgi:O-methyltransferase
MIAQAFEYQAINEVKGDYLEFGLYRGRTFCYAHRMKHRYGRKDMLLWGFDSFQGLPPIDGSRDNIWAQGEFSCNESELRRILRRNGLTEEEYRLVPGYYEDSAPAYHFHSVVRLLSHGKVVHRACRSR